MLHTNQHTNTRGSTIFSKSVRALTPGQLRSEHFNPTLKRFNPTPHVKLAVLSVSERVKRWLEKHVRVQAYVDREDYEKVEELAGKMGLSVSELVKRAILDLKRLEEEVYEKGFEDGFEFAEQDLERQGPYLWCGVEEFAIPCPKCGKPMLFTSRDERLWREVKPRLVEAFSEYTHKRCAEDRSGSRAAQAPDNPPEG